MSSALCDRPPGLPLLCLGGRDVVVEAEEVVRVVAPLDLPQPLELRVSVRRAHAFDGLVWSSVVEVAAAAGPALPERGGRAPRLGDVGGVRGRVLPGGHGAHVEALLPAAERGGVRGHAQRGAVHLLDQHLVPAVRRVSEVVVDDLAG